MRPTERTKSTPPAFEPFAREAKAARAHPGILLDLQGPKIRLGRFENKECVLQTGATFTITTEPVIGNCERRLHRLRELRARCEARRSHPAGRWRHRTARRWPPTTSRVRTEVVTGGRIGDHKGINLPGVKVSIPSLTEKDLQDLHFGLTAGVDMVALSFVRTADDVQQLRDRLGGRPVSIVAKIEKPEGWENIEPILRRHRRRDGGARRPRAWRSRSRRCRAFRSRSSAAPGARAAS